MSKRRSLMRGAFSATVSCVFLALGLTVEGMGAAESRGGTATGRSPAGCEGLLSRLTPENARDPAALQGLLEEAEDAGCSSLVTLLCRRALDLPESPGTRLLRCDAAFRLAKIELERQRFESAYRLLLEVISRCPEHAEARNLFQSAESDRTRTQRLHVHQGDQYVRGGEFSKALDEYEAALKLTPEDPAGSPYAPKTVILQRLAECRDRVDEAYAKERVIFIRSVKICDQCGAGEIPGFQKCATCRGTGTVSRSVLVRAGTTVRRVTVQVACESCNGHKAQACSECGGLGYVSKSMTPQEKRTLRALVLSAASPELFNLTLPRAIAQVEKELLAVRDGSSLNFLRAMKADYALSKELREAIGGVPPEESRADHANDQWRTMQDRKARFNFLIHYGCEYAKYVQHFDMLRSSSRPDSRRLVSAREWKDDVLAPEVLSAFPDEAEAGWLAVEATLLGVKSGDPETHKGYIEIDGGAKGKVVFFVWLPTAQDHLERIAGLGWRSAGIRNLVNEYPPDLWERLQGAQRSHRVLLVGRFLRDRFAEPRNWFEVWDFKVGLSLRQDEIVRALEAPLDIELPPMELKQAAQILGSWCDLEMSLERVDGSRRIECSAAGSPRGLVVDFIVGQVPGADWYYRDKRVVVCPRGANPIPSDMETVLSTLRGNETDGSVGKSTAIVQRDGPTEPNPDDEAGLKAEAKSAIDAMDYARAAGCLKRLAAMSGESRVKVIVNRVRAKLLIFHELTRRTPVSRLVGASELHEITYRKPSGDLIQATVILKREGTSWTIQEDYGASIQIRPERVVASKSVPVEAWRRKKEAALDERERESRRAPPLERVAALFLNALYAKTSGFPLRGDALLNEAVKLEEFETFIETFFPEKSDALLGLWRCATGFQPRPPIQTTVSPPSPQLAVREPSPGEAPPETAVPAFPTGLDDPRLVAKLREYAGEASACVRGAMGMDGGGAWRRRAIAFYEEAERGARELQARHPGDPYAQSVLSQIVSARSSLIKDMGFYE